VVGADALSPPVRSRALGRECDAPLAAIGPLALRRSQRARGRPCQRQTWGRNFGARPARLRLAVTEGKRPTAALSTVRLLLFASTLSVLPRTQTRHTQWLAKRLVTRPPPPLPLPLSSLVLLTPRSDSVRLRQDGPPRPRQRPQ
jgi:hypothetical protein